MASSGSSSSSTAMEAQPLITMDSLLASFGLDCFMNVESGLTGRIKDRPEDFMVTEIDRDGVLASVGDRLIPSLPVEHTSASTAKRMKISGNKPCVSKTDTSGVPLEGLQKEYIHSDVTLEDLVGKLNVDKLSALSTSYRQTKTAEDQVISLGTCNDKEKRTILHRTVRLTYPVLKTITHKTESGDAEVHVVADPSYAELVQHLPEDVCEEVVLFASRHVPPGVSTLELPVERDRSKRKEIHRTVNRLFGAYIESKTFDDQDEGPSIHLRYRQKGGRKRSKMDGDDSSEEFYLQFCLKKESMETLDVINRLSQLLHCQPSHFFYSGVKDRKAVTIQNMVVKGITADKLDALNDDRPRLMKFGNYRYVDRPLGLGDHCGNLFEIVLRDVCPHDSTLSLEECIDKAVSGVQQGGFVNYYGQQRFGLEDATVNAWNIGLAMLKEQHMDAVKMILQPDLLGANDPVSQAKLYFTETRDVEGTLAKMPNYKPRECMVLKALQRYGFDEFGCTKALLNVPYRMRLMYVHSFTSLVWNHLVTYRLRCYGNDIVEGDLVETATDKPGESSTRVVTANDISEKKYSLSDVVLPLVGVNTSLPKHSVGDMILQLLGAAGLTFASFKMKALSLAVPGSYRKLLSYPKNLSWKILPRVPLSHDQHVTSPPKSDSVFFKVTLDTSCYATVFLREITKQKKCQW